MPRKPADPPPSGPLHHVHVTLVEVADPLLLVQLKADPRVANLITAELSDRVVVVRPGFAEALLKVLRKAGHTPKVIE